MAHSRDTKQRTDACVIFAAIFVPVAVLHIAAAAPQLQTAVAALVH
jgi:hypothetical protein